MVGMVDMDIRSSSSDERTTDGNSFGLTVDDGTLMPLSGGRDVVACQPAPRRRVYPILPIHPAASGMVTV